MLKLTSLLVVRAFAGLLAMRRWYAAIALGALCTAVFGGPVSAAPFSPSMKDLAGLWRFQPDPKNIGLEARWFSQKLAEQIELPGDMVQRGFGQPITAQTAWTGSIFDPSYYKTEHYAPYREPHPIKIPFWLQPERSYSGAAWYQCEVEVPADWRQHRVVLLLERPHWATQVWCDERSVGERQSLSTPHEYDLGFDLTRGKHRLTVRVDNSRVVDVGENSHSISDHTQGNWNGIIGRIQLSVTKPVWISSIEVYPSLEPRGVTVKGQVDNVEGHARPATIQLTCSSDAANPKAARSVETAIRPDGRFERWLDLPSNAPLWDEFQPALHRLTATLENGESKAVTFGLRTVSASGNQLLINGRKLFIRGTLECAIFPRTGHPPTDVASWKQILQVVRDHGLNSLRFHSWCPPEAAFVAGDEMGFYFEVEAASWPNQSTTLGDGKPVDTWLEEETQRVLQAYGNHPCFILMASSNEPGGDAANAYLSKWLTRRRASDNRRLFTSGAGWPQLPENQFHITSDPRVQHWGEGLASRINAQPPETRTDYSHYISERNVPVISHEIGQWCVYPDFSEMAKYTGYLKPRNFEIFRDNLEHAGLLSLAQSFLLASGKLQALCYKEDIEAALRTPGMAGFQLLGLQDFPGQGTALVGVVNPFWESKGYVSGEAFRRFCNATVPLARLERRVFTTTDTLHAACEVAHFGAAPLPHARSSWKLSDIGGKVVRSGSFEPRDLPIGNALRLGEVDMALADLPAPAKYNFQVTIDDTPFANDWDIWVYPPITTSRARPDVLFTHDLEQALLSLQRGETVLLSLPPGQVANDTAAPVKMGFSTIFWNTSWTTRQAPTTMGIFCDPRHPALAAFPTEFHSNWQWWYVVTHAAPMLLKDLSPEVKPIVRVIDDWFTARPLALVVEAKLGNGRLLLTSIDLDAADNPVTAQLRESLLNYAASIQFRPTGEIAPDQLRALTALH